MEKIIISCLESRVETNRSIYARFLLGPFKDDQAVTIATALRRSLLSQVKNIAITAIHIQGVTHEFSTIVGVRESVLDLALNFQQVVLRTQSNKQANLFNENKHKTKIGKRPVGFKNQSKILHKSSDTLNTYHNKPGLLVCRTFAHCNVAKAPLLQNGVFAKVNLDMSKSDARTKTNRGRLWQKQSLYKEGGLPVTSRSLNHVAFDSCPVTPLKETEKIGYLQVQGPKVIYANDLKLPVGVECVDPTQYIATLSTEGLLVVKFVISEKKVSFENNKEKLIANLSPDVQNGYQNIAPTQLLSRQADAQAKLVPAKKASAYKNESGNLRGVSNYGSNKAEPYYPDTSNVRIFDSTISLRHTIFLDPIFDSVFKVNYLIEKDDLFNQPRERILLELWTNGSIHPRQALHKASLSLISTFSIFRNVFHLDSL